MSIGGALAEARRQAGLTVSQVSQRTRIREGIITGIENDDYSVCGGDFYARGHLRSIAHAVGADPEPLIAEYDSTRRQPPVTGAAALRPFSTPLVRERRPRSANWGVLMALILAAALALGIYQTVRGGKASTAGGRRPVTSSLTGHSSPPRPRQSSTPTVAPTPPAVPPSHPLDPVSVTAFGPAGISAGDNPSLAPLAIDGSPATAWKTDWYASPRFTGPGQGTGLLLDMGHRVWIASLRVRLGAVPGAVLQVRVGDVPALADLRVQDRAGNVWGLTRLRLASPAHGRYVLLWFTALPPDVTGTYQASVYNVTLSGH